MPIVDLTGQKIGMWSVMRRGETINKHGTYICRCQCGTVRPVFRTCLTSGNSTNCGCSRNRYIPHGQAKTRLYRIWQNMKRRCYLTTSKVYQYYGARGISVCDEWQDYIPFEKWARDNGYEYDLTLDRIDVNGDYRPDNCRWVTQKFQNRNKRYQLFITYNGETRTLIDWSEITGIGYDALYSRVQKGWTGERLFSAVDVRFRKGKRRA